MNQLNRALLLPSSMIVVVVVAVSNVHVVASPGNTSGLSSNIQVYNRGELVTISVLFLGLIGLLILLTRTLKQRTKRRRTFGTQTKKLILRNQNFKCVKCGVNAGIWDFDHKNRNRANNKASNCQSICPTCHARKSRGLIKCETQNKSKSISIGIAVGIILMMILFFYM